MLLADVKQTADSLHIQTLDKPYRAELRSLSIVFLQFIGFAAIGVTGSYGLTVVAQLPGAPRTGFAWHDVLMIFGVITFMVLGNAVPIIMDMRYPLAFILDKGRNAFIVNGEWLGCLDMTDIRLQDSIAFNRRAFRIVAQVGGRDYIIVRTRRVNADALTSRNQLYSLDATIEGTAFKYQYGRWNDYVGTKTGFDPKWPEYVEIFALHARLKEFIRSDVSKNPPP